MNSYHAYSPGKRHGTSMAFFLSLFFMIVLFAAPAGIFAQEEGSGPETEEEVPAEPIRIFVTQVEYDLEEQAYFAVFGYLNDNEQTVYIPVGSANRFNRNNPNQGQPEYFEPGRVDSAFRTPLDGDNKVWTLKSPNGSQRTSTAPGGVNLSPVLEDTELANGGNFQRYDPVSRKFIADFGYNNPFPYPVIIPVGSENRFTGNQDRGQPSVFEPGRQIKAFEVPLDPGQQTVWTLAGRTSTADAPDEATDTGVEDAGTVQGTNPGSEVVNEESTEIIENWEQKENTTKQVISEAFQIETDTVDGVVNLSAVTLEFQVANQDSLQVLIQILKAANLIQDNQIIPNGGLNKLILRVPSSVADQLSNDNALATVAPRLIKTVESVEIPLRPFTNRGLIDTQGDTAQKSDFVRGGYNLLGRGVTIGILSDSYDFLGGASASEGGDLPSGGVDVLKDTLGGDEGRAMAEIIHDVAPGADLKFHTAFISEGDFANGIRALAAAGSNIIVDDVTYPGAPIFSEGPISDAVSEVVSSHNVIYFTSAGNFADHSYKGNFATGSFPAELDGDFPDSVDVHSYGGGVFQNISVGPGTHILGLQWDNDFVTNEIGGGPNTGSEDDLDIYIYTADNILVADANKDNIGNDPFEFVVFETSETVELKVLVTRKVNGTGEGLPFQYIFFRTNDFSFVSPSTGANATTIFGHAANPLAVSVAAVPFFNTQIVEPFSSKGFSEGGVTKPDYTSVDGGNTSFFGIDSGSDPDLFPNFFGTSAAAPHLAGLAALLAEGYDSLTVEGGMTRSEMIATFDGVAIDVEDPSAGAGTGVDLRTGKGFVRADLALLTLGNPAPSVTGLDLSDQNETDPTFDLRVKGNFFVDGGSAVIVGNDTLAPISVVDTLITVNVDTGLGSTPIQVFNNSVAATGTDGGTSETITADEVFFVVNVKVKDEVKRYLEPVPSIFELEFTVDPTVDGIGLELTTEDTATLLTLFNNPAFFSTEASDTSSIGFYRINFEPELPEPVEGESAQFGFNVEPGLLIVEPFQLSLKAKDVTIKEGEPIASQLDYVLEGDFSAVTVIGEGEVEALLNSILEVYKNNQAEGIAIANLLGQAIVNDFDISDLAGYSQLISETAYQDGAELMANGDKVVTVDKNNLAALLADPNAEAAIGNLAQAIVNGNLLFGPDGEVTISFDKEGDAPGSNLGQAIVNLFAKAIVNGGNVTDSEALINLAQAIVNLGGQAIVNDADLSESLVNFAQAIVNGSGLESGGTTGGSDGVSNLAQAIVNLGGQAIVNDAELDGQVGGLVNFAQAIVNLGGQAIVNEAALSNFAQAIVNFAQAIVNLRGKAIVNLRGQAIVNGKGLGADNPFLVILSLADSAELAEEENITFFPIPLVTGNTVGQHQIVPGSAVLTNLFAQAIVNLEEGGSAQVSIPLGNFEFLLEPGLLTVEDPTFQGPGIEARVWNDLNGDGRQNNNETEGIPGVEVLLLDASNKNQQLNTRTTDADGKVTFTDVPFNRSLRLEFVNKAGFARTGQNLGGDENKDSDARVNNGRTGTFVFNEANNFLVKDQDAGLFKPGTIVATVWDDANGDGRQNNDEDGRIQDVEVLLLDASNKNQELATAATDENGEVTFNNVPTDVDVRLEFMAKEDHARTGQDQTNDVKKDSDARVNNGRTAKFRLDRGSAVVDTIDAGLYAPGTIVATVWDDANGDGRQNNDEDGRIQGVEVLLLDASNKNQELATAATDENGEVTFNNVPTDVDLRLEFMAKEDHARTGQDQTNDVTKDSDAQVNNGRTAKFRLDRGSAVVDTIDAGLYAPGTIVATVWDDANGDGRQNNDEDGRIQGVEVLLLDASNKNQELATAATDENGEVTFNNVPTDVDLRLEFMAKEDHARTGQDQTNDVTKDSDARVNNGRTAKFRLDRGSAVVDTIDAGLYAPGTLIAMVWLDENGDGKKQKTETQGLSGIEIRLLSASDGNTQLKKHTTDETGTATFNSVPTDVALRLEFGEKSGFAFTLQDEGSKEEADSDANPANGRTAPFNLTQGSQTILDQDAGYVESSETVPEMTSILAQEKAVLEETPIEFEIFPNPARDRAYIVVPENASGVSWISIMDGLGRLTSEQTAPLVPGDRIELNFTSLKKGVYFVQIRWDDQLKMYKILKN